MTDKEFWEKCGCRLEATKLNGSPAWSIYFPDGRCETNYLGEESHSLTLDNLFKYAVPKVKGILSESQMGKLMVDWLQDYLYVGVDPTQSLFKALRNAFGLDGG